MEILSISLTAMTQQGLMGYFERIEKVISSVETHNAELARSRSRLITAMRIFDGALKAPTKSYLTELIQLEDEKRKNNWSNIRRVKNHKKTSDLELNEAARKVGILLDTYGDAQKGSDTERSAKVTNFLQDIERTMEEEMLKKLGIDFYIEELQDANKKYLELVLERKQLYNVYAVGSSMQARKEAVKAYRQFTSLLNVFIVAHPELVEVYNLVERINEVIEIEKPKLKSKKTRLATKADEKVKEETAMV